MGLFRHLLLDLFGWACSGRHFSSLVPNWRSKAIILGKTVSTGAAYSKNKGNSVLSRQIMMTKAEFVNSCRR